MSLHTFIIINAISNLIFGVGGYYLSHRGLAGVKSDIQDIGSDVKKINTKVTALKAAA